MLNRPSSTSDSETRRTVWPNSSAISSAVSASIRSPGFIIWPCFIMNLTTSTARSVMRCASSWMVMVSGSRTSREIFSRGSEVPIWARLIFSWRRRMADRDRERPSLSPVTLASVSLPRRRLSSRPRDGLGAVSVLAGRLAAAPRRASPSSVRPGATRFGRRAARAFLFGLLGGLRRGFGLGGQTRLFGLLGFLALGHLALAARFFFLAPLLVGLELLAVVSLARLGFLERATACLDLALRQFLENRATAVGRARFLRRCRRRRRRRRFGSRFCARLQAAGKRTGRRLFAGLGKLALARFDDNGVGASAAHLLAHGALAADRASSRACGQPSSCRPNLYHSFLIRFLRGHMPAGLSGQKTGACVRRSRSPVWPSPVVAQRFKPPQCGMATPAVKHGCMYYITAPECQTHCWSSRSMKTGTSGPPRCTVARRAWSSLRMPSGAAC
jgi:hypothetical protein